MPVLAAAVLPAALLEDDEFRQTVLRDDRRGNGSPGHDWRPKRQPAFAAQGQNVCEGDRAAGFRLELLNLQHRVWRDAILFAAGADDCEHRIIQSGIVKTKRMRGWA